MKPYILLIEDEPEIRHILSELLTSSGYRVCEAGDGEEGMIRFEQNSFDLVLLDLMMPRMDGYAVCEKIRRTSAVPIIILTALDGEAAQIRAFQLHADDYITKPFSLPLVLLWIEAVLRRSASTLASDPSPLLIWRDIALDEQRHEVTKKNVPVSLTQLEYGLLRLFLSHPHQVFTREMLLNQIWGYDFFGEEKAVNIHIMNLRRKLGADCVETVRGVGYRLGKEN